MKCKFKSRKPRRVRKTIDSSVHLPMTTYHWRVLGWLAEDLRQFLTDEDYEKVVEICRNRDISSYLSLSEIWGLQSITPGACSFAETQAKYALSSLLKKFQFATERDERISAAKEKFFKAESVCYNYNHSDYRKLSWAEDERGAELFTYAQQFMQKLLGDSLPSASKMTEWSRHGPGATLDTETGHTSAYDKYRCYPYSCTVGAVRYARFVIQTDQRWYGALQDEYRKCNGIPKQMPLNLDEFWEDVIKIVPGNRITFVPKSAKIERTIAIEPTMNLYLQLGVDGYIRRRLKRWGVDLDDQTKNQELARRGSLEDGDDSFVTLDLAAASDTISLKLCELLLPTAWYQYLIDLRSPEGVLGGETISYEKVSSMGCGFTFALESAIFTAIMYGVMRTAKVPYDAESCAVYGDDLIVRKRFAAPLIQALTNCGFAINTEKSFLEGPVRESCGADWIEGKPVRPVFFDTVPTDVKELWADINRLHRFLTLRFGLEESNVCTRMKKWIPDVFKTIKGPYSNEEFDTYLHVARPHDEARYAACTWVYKRLTKQPRSLIGPRFLMRKLMHDLRPVPPKPQKWEEGKGKGSRFTVTHRNAMIVGLTRSEADFWPSEYGDIKPPIQLPWLGSTD